MLFEPKSKNRRLNPKELETEYELCSIFHRPPRTYLHDKPFYPWLPPEPIVPSVNFDLNFKK